MTEPQQIVVSKSVSDAPNLAFIENLIITAVNAAVSGVSGTGPINADRIVDGTVNLAYSLAEQAKVLDRANHNGTESADVLFDGVTNKAYTAVERLKLSTVAISATANSSDAFLLNRANQTGIQTADSVVDGVTNKVYTAAEKTKVASVATGATQNSADSFLLNRANHTGTETADAVVDGVTNKAYTGAEKTKLAGIASGATANSTDAFLLARANQTGTESADVIVDGTTNKAYTATEKTKLAGIAAGATNVVIGTSAGQAADGGQLANEIAQRTALDALAVKVANDIGGTPALPQVVATHLASALPINQGGTGSTTQPFVDLTAAQTIGGVKTFTSLPQSGATPSSSSDFVTKSYADSLAQGLATKGQSRLATAAALPANTYSAGVLTATGNAALTIDGVAVATSDRVLIKNEAAAANNGIYTVTNAGSAGAAYVLTRATDMDAAGEVLNAATYVTAGTTNAGSGFVVTGTGPWTLGTTAINWTQNSGGAVYTGSSGIVKTGNNFTADTSFLATVSSVTTGVSAAENRANHYGTQTADTLTDGTTNKAYLATERIKLISIAVSATANSADSFLLARANHTGTESADVITDGTTNKAYTAVEQLKLASIAASATKNSPDAALLARANHTGTESADVLTDGTTNKAYTTVEQLKLASIAASATKNSTDAFLLARANATGTESADVLVDGATNKAYTAVEQLKLSTIAASATKNLPDATLLDRSQQTGTQVAATISDLAAAVAAEFTNGGGIQFTTDPVTGQITISAISGTTTATKLPSKPTLIAPNGLRFFDAALADAKNALVPIYCIGDSLTQAQGANGINVDDEAGLVTGISQWPDSWVRDAGRRFAQSSPDPGEGVILTQDARWVMLGSSGTDYARNTFATRLGCYGSGVVLITTSGAATLPIEAACTAVEVEWLWRPGHGAPVVSWTNMGVSSAITPTTPGTARTATIAIATGRHTMTNHGFVVGDIIGGTNLVTTTGINTNAGGFTNSYYEVASVIDANTFTIAQDGVGPTYGGADGSWSVAKLQWVKTIIPNPDTTTSSQSVILKCASSSARAYVVQVRKLNTTVNSRGVAGYGTCGVQLNRMGRGGYASADLDGTGIGVTSSTSKNIIKKGTFSVGAQKVATGTPFQVNLVQSTSLVNKTSHGLKIGDRVTLDSITGITDLNETTVFWVAQTGLDKDNFKLATTQSGSAITFTGANGTANATPRASFAGLLVIQLGANDFANQGGTAGANRLGITPTAFEAYVRAVIPAWVAEGGEVMLIGEPEHTNTASPATMQDYRDKFKLIAQSLDHTSNYSIAESWGSSSESHLNGFQLPGTIHASRAGYSDMGRIFHAILSDTGRSRFYDPTITAPGEISLPTFTGHVTLTPGNFTGSAVGNWDLELGTPPSGYTPSTTGTSTLRQLLVNGADIPTDLAANETITYDASGGPRPRLIHTVGGDVKPSAPTTKWDWSSHLARARYKLPEKSSAAPTGAWRLVHQFGLPTGFNSAQDSYARLCNTDNFTVTNYPTTGTNTGALDSNEMRVMFVIYSDHLPRLLVDHETKNDTLTLWTGTTPLSESDHVVDIFYVPSQTGTGSFYIKIDGVLMNSGQNMNTAPASLAPSELVVTRVVAGLDGVADQDKPNRPLSAYTYQTDFYWV